MRWLFVVFVFAARTAIAQPSVAELFDQGQAAFDHRDYVTAIATWQHLYRISAEPELLFDVAQAQRLSGDCRGALETYHQFLSLPSNSAKRSLAEDLAKELSTRCGKATPPRLVAVAPYNKRRIGLAVGGASSAIVLVGLVLGSHAATLGDEVTKACAGGCMWAAERSKDAAGHRDATLGHVFDGVGVAGLLLGAGLYVWGMRDVSAGITVRSDAEGTTVSWSRRW